MRNLSLIIDGYYGRGSIGDEAILAGFIDAFSDFTNEIKITVISHNQENTRLIHNVSTVGRGIIDWFFTIPEKISKSDCYIFGGGNLLHDKHFYTLPMFLFRLLLVKIMKKKIFILNQGIGPIYTKIGKKLLKFGLNNTDIITVRDPLSSKYLTDLGVHHSITADPVFAIKHNEIIPINPPISEKIKIGVALRSPLNFEPIKPNNYEDVLAKTLDKCIEELNAEIIFIPMTNSFSLSNDFKIIQSVIKKMKNEKSFQILEYNENPKHMINIYSKFDFVIGTPLHSLIFSTIVHTPFIGINYHPKVEGYIKLIQYNTDFLIRIDQLNVSMIMKKVKLLISNSKQIENTLSLIDKKKKKKAREGILSSITRTF